MRRARRDHDIVTLGIAIAAIILFVGTAGVVLPTLIRAFQGAAPSPDLALTNALLLNIALILLGWNRYKALTAELAAQRATDTDKALLSRIIEDMRHAHQTHEPDDELAADVEFHNAVGEAAHNIILLHTMRACYRLLSEGIFFNRKAVFSLPNARERLLDQHVAIHDAILAGDPAAAKAAAQAHIDFVMRAADESARAGEWGRVAKLRLIRRDGGRTGRTTSLSKTETKA